MSPKIAPFPVYEGELVLSASWLLTRNHRSSVRGVPVLVYTPTGQAFSPNDVVFPPLSFGAAEPAADLVKRMLKVLPPGERDKARAFLM